MPEIDDEGRLPLPDEILECYHLEPGTTVRVETEGGRIVLEPERPPEEILARMDELLEEVRNGEIQRAETANENDPFARSHREKIRSGIDDDS